MKAQIRSDNHGYRWKALAKGCGYVMIQNVDLPRLPIVVSSQVWNSWPKEARRQHV